MFVCVHMHACMCADAYTHVQVSKEARRGFRTPGAGVKDSCEQPDLGVENQSGPLQEQQVLLTAELSFLSCFIFKTLTHSPHFDSTMEL